MTEGNHESEQEYRAMLEGAVRDYYIAIDAGDMDRALELFAPDATYDRGNRPAISGQEALSNFYHGERVIAQGTHEITDVIVEPPTVTVRGKFSGTLKTGKSIATEFEDVFEFENGKVTKRKTTFQGPEV